MKELIIIPEGWRVTVAECLPGFFVYCDELCFKTDTTDHNGRLLAFRKGSGTFWGDTKNLDER